jgi:hypothetical protein
MHPLPSADVSYPAMKPSRRLGISAIWEQPLNSCKRLGPFYSQRVPFRSAPLKGSEVDNDWRNIATALTTVESARHWAVGQPAGIFQRLVSLL